MRKVRPLAIPFGLFFLACVFFVNIEILPQSLLKVLPYLCYAVLLVGMVVSYFFNRSKFLFVFLLLMLIQFAFVSTTNRAVFEPLYLVIAMLAPLNVWLFSIFPECSVTTVWGAVRMALVLCQVLLLIVIANGGFHLVKSFFVVNPMPQVAIVCFLAVFLYLMRSKQQEHFRNSILVVLLSLFALFSFKDSISLAAPVFLTISGLVLVSSLVRESYSMAYLDELTGLPARRALKEAMANLRGKYTIAMVDIDHFKKINDNYGHDTGDDVLRHLSSVLSRTSEGKVFRSGGEEFVIIFPGKDVSSVRGQLEAIRRAVEEKCFFIRGTNSRKSVSRGKGGSKGITVTVSIGAAEKNERNRTPEKVLKMADEAMYSAKDEGRNRVCAAE